ncbi:MAG: DUF547 domain-containing protein [Anaerolineae bacterium]
MSSDDSASERVLATVSGAVRRGLLAFYGIDPTEVLNAGTRPWRDRSEVEARGADPAEAAGRPTMAAVLRESVNSLMGSATHGRQGSVDYSHLRESQAYADHQECAARLAAFEPDELSSRAERTAFWINLYNALVIDAVIAYGIEKSVREVSGFFWRAAYRIGGERYSANDLEHGILRANRGHPAIPGPHFGPDDPRRAHVIEPVDPRVHFALNCASRSCPPISVYDAAHLEQQLDLAARSFVNNGGVQVDPESRRVSLSRIFLWYRRDFGGARRALELIIPFLDDGPEKTFLSHSRNGLKVNYQSYDWTLNG